MAFNQLLNSTKLPLGQAKILRELNLGLDPELRFPLRRLDIHMDSRLFAREEKAAKRPLPEDRRTHLARARNDPASAASPQGAVRCKPMFGDRAGSIGNLGVTEGKCRIWSKTAD